MEPASEISCSDGGDRRSSGTRHGGGERVGVQMNLRARDPL